MSQKKKKPKLLIISDCFLPRWDGIARFLTQAIPGLASTFDITVVAPEFPGGEPDFPGLKKVTLLRLPTIKMRVSDYNSVRLSAKAFRTVKRAVSEADILFVQTIGPVIGWMAIIAARMKRKPVVCYYHTIEQELVTGYLSLKGIVAIIMNWLLKRATRFLYNNVSLIIVPDQESGELLSWNGIRTKKAIVHLGVDVKKFRPARSRAVAKKKIGLEPDALTIGFLPRLTGEKDPLTLLRAFARIRKSYPKLVLLAIGDGEPAIIKKFSDQPGVMVLGIQNDVVPYLQAMDINVLPSLTETTSLSTFEAMACGCAIISTPVGFVKEYIQDGKNGMFFNKKEVYKLSRLMRKLLDDKELRTRLGAEARRTVSEQFSWKRTLDRVRYLLEAELESSKRGA